MILSELRDYLQTHKRSALLDMTRRFGIEPDALRGMLEKWVAKGKVEKLSQGKQCAEGCCKCDLAIMEVYEWKE